MVTEVRDGNLGSPTETSPPSVICHHDPPPLMTNHPPRVTDSNISITLREDYLKESFPTSDNGLDWVQIQQKSLRWEEDVKGSTVITHEGLTTLVHPNQGWTITSGMWNTLRVKWGLTSETLQRIHESCTSQSQEESVNIFTHTSHILQTIKRVWQVEGLHGLPTIAASTFFPKASKNKDIWWETKTSLNTPRDENENESRETEDAWDPSDEQEEGGRKTTSYIWDSMDEEDREDSMDILKQSDEWVIWKSKDKWTILLKAAGFHQFFYIKKELGKNKTKIPPGAQDVIITTLQAPNHNFGKDEHVVDMMGHEAHYWQGTESGLLGVFEFKGSCTSGDGSCDTGYKSMGSGFCNLGQLGWNTQTPLPPSTLHDQRTRSSRKVGREDEGVRSTRPEMVALTECLEDSETQPLKITRCGRPQENYNQITKESSSGSSNITSQSQSSQGGPSQRGSRRQGRNGTSQRNQGGLME
jgi:hypothetical protein